MPLQHRHHHTTTMEPLDLPRERRHRPRRQRRPSLTLGIVRGSLRYFQAWVIIVVLLALAIVAFLFFGAIASNDLPSVGDKISGWLNEHTTTTAP